MDLKQPHPILIGPAAQWTNLGLEQQKTGRAVSQENSQTRNVATNMSKITAGVRFYNQTLTANVERIGEFIKILEGHLSGKETSSARTDRKSHFAQKLQTFASATWNPVLSARWQGVRISNGRRIQDILSRSQRCKEQLCLSASETNKRFEPIRRQQEILEAEMGKVKRSLQSSSKVKDRFYLNPGFIRSVEPLLKALDSCMKLRIESDKCSEEWPLSSQFAHPHTEERMIGCGEELINFSQKLIEVARDIEMIMREMGCQKVSMDYSRSIRSSHASAQMSGIYTQKALPGCRAYLTTSIDRQKRVIQRFE
ncbi:hypothetical protein KCU89_g36, partial [Aureobasidium melanogenum]